MKELYRMGGGGKNLPKNYQKRGIVIIIFVTKKSPRELSILKSKKGKEEGATYKKLSHKGREKAKDRAT